MTTNFRFTQRADADLKAIWAYLKSEDSEATADKVVARIIKECSKLGDMPGMGHHHEDVLDKSHRFWRVWSYLIVYKWQEEPIQIVAVVHGARDLRWFFNEGPP